MADQVEVAARALYEHWVEEDFGNEYCSWDQLPDQATWLSRGRAVVEALNGSGDASGPAAG